MRQRGRKSAAADLVQLRVDGSAPRLEPPPCLKDGERILFNELVAACSSNHFVKSDLPLLISYTQATAMAQRSAHCADKIAVWEKAVRVQAMLATRLRLSPQSRMDPKTLAPMRPPRLTPAPWE